LWFLWFWFFCVGNFGRGVGFWIYFLGFLGFVLFFFIWGGGCCFLPLMGVSGGKPGFGRAVERRFLSRNFPGRKKPVLDMGEGRFYCVKKRVSGAAERLTFGLNVRTRGPCRFERVMSYHNLTTHLGLDRGG